MVSASSRDTAIRCAICGKMFPASEVVAATAIHGGVVSQIKSTCAEWSDECSICQHDLQRLRHAYLTTTLTEEQGELSELQRELLKSIADNESIVKNLNDEFSNKLSLGDRLADSVASFGGSWKFIISFMAILFLWILLNSIMLFRARPFDPFPFILLNLVLSCVAAIQAPVIMMSQNRQEAKDRLRAEQDFRTNLKAELEIRTLHAKLDELITHQWQRLMEIQQMQIDLMEELTGRAAGKEGE